MRRLLFAILLPLAACAPALPPRPDPAAILPAEAVRAYVQHVRTADMPQLQFWIPELATVPLTALPSTVALLDLPEGEYGWVRFGDEGTVTAASSPQTLQLLGTGAVTLPQTPSFSQLRQHAGTTAWAYITGKQPYAIATESGAFLLETLLKPEGTPSASAALPPLPLLGSGTSLSISVADVDALRSLLPLLDRRERSGLDSVLHTLLQRVIGAEATFSEHAEPLLQHPFSIAFSGNAALNDLQLLLRGEADDPQPLLERLHAIVNSRSPAMTAEVRTFDNRFTQDTLRLDPRAVTEQRLTQNGWNIHIALSNTDGRHVGTATRGTQYILTTDALHLDGFLSDPAAFPSEWTSLPGDVPLAAGALRSDGLPPSFRALLTPLLAPMTAPDLFWTLSRNANRLRLQVRPLEEDTGIGL